jgi:hypothetical protein
MTDKESGANPGFSRRQPGYPVEGKKRHEVYDWITWTLLQQVWRERDKKVRGLLRRYIEKMAGLSRTQVIRLMARYMEHSK